MKLHFTEKQERLRKLVRDFAKGEIEPYLDRMEQGEFPRHIVDKMAEMGLMGIPIPEEYGGRGMDFISYIAAIEELSKVSATVGVILSVHTSVGTNPILHFGTPEQKRKYIPKLAKGEHLGAFCLTEPGSGSDAASLRTKAVKQGDYYIINGSKIFITNGGEADTYIVFASTNPEARRKGISAFIVERGTPGFHIGKDERKMGLHGSRTVQLTFEDMKVAAKSLLGAEGEGFQVAMSNLNAGRIGIAAQALGIAEAALEKAIIYVKERRSMGEQSISEQGVDFRLADMATNVEAAKLLVYRAAFLHSQGLPCEKEASMAKLFASNTAMEAAAEAIQVFGRDGYSKNHPVERYFRDAKITQIYEGTNEIQRIVISKRL
ncbi:MAG: acyl-CoA dehydrogenase [Bacillales bacterium]|nr:acyl-CoA dehydrogenase [Bacillales bacterium]